MTIRRWIEAGFAFRGTDGSLDDRTIKDAVDLLMLSQISEIARKRLECIDTAFGTDEDARKKCIETDVRADVVYDITGLDRTLEDTPLFVLVAAEPTSMVARSDDPFLAAKRALQNGEDCGSGDQAQRRAQHFAEESLVRDAREIDHFF